MGSARQPKVLMLGWEYPPRFAGGLGKACRGLSLGMAKANAQVFFVLPTFPERISEPHLEVVGARESLIEAGWTESFYEEMVRRQAESGTGILGGAGFEVIRTQARMFPYGAHPSGPVPEEIRRFMAGGSNAPVENAESFERKTVKISSPMGMGAEARPQPAPQPAKAAGSGEIYGKNLWSEIERFCFAVRQMAESHEVDVVHAHDWMTFPAAFEYQRMTGAPVFLHVHATEYDRSGENVHSDVFRIEREGFRRATHIFAVSRYTAGIIERLYGVSKRKISVVYNAPDDDAKHLAMSPDAPREPNVVFLGRLTFQKGPDHFLRAAALVAKADPKAKFVFCGTGDMFDKLRAQAHQLGIEDRVHFAGFVDPAGVDQILQKSKVLVMPSVSEPFGLVALEAIHCGIPVILSKQSGVREVLHRALQVDFWDHEKLADQILASLRLSALSRQLVNDGMDQVQLLSWEKSAKKVIDVYRNYIGSTYAQAIGGAHGH